MLSVLDRKWREHLYEMDYLKEGIGLRAMAQRDPLVEYQREGYDMFAAMLDSLKEESVGFLYNLQVQVVSGDQAAAQAGAQPAAAVGAGNGGAASGEARESAGPAVGTGPAGGPGTAGTAAQPAQKRRVRPIEALPSQQAAATAASATPSADSAPAALRAKGLGGPNGESSGSLTYTGPREGGGTETTGAAANRRQAGATVTKSKQPGRNEQCPCGSGKKYKVCHGRPGAAPL